MNAGHIDDVIQIRSRQADDAAERQRLSARLQRIADGVKVDGRSRARNRGQRISARPVDGVDAVEQIDVARDAGEPGSRHHG